MKLIALSGKMTSGKSTVADYLVKVYGFQKVSFAEALRRELMATHFTGVYEKPTPLHLRELLIAWGKARRVQDPNYWLQFVEEKIEWCISMEELHNEIEPRIVIDDMRFQNELSMVLRYGAVPIRITKTEPLSSLFVAPHPGLTHVESDISETDLDGMPFYYYLKAEGGDVKGLLECAGQLFNRMEL